VTTGLLREKVVAERVSWVRDMVRQARALPLENPREFTSDRRNTASAESYLRRGLEALLDLGRHLLAKGFGIAAAEYKQVARGLEEVGVLGAPEATLLETMAGYRNRMVHFYSEVTDQELYELCRTGTDDIEQVLEVMLAWLGSHPDRMDRSL
jgi:uncharacterized protein YutE (UPF0331/DUF86 family)